MAEHSDERQGKGIPHLTSPSGMDPPFRSFSPVPGSPSHVMLQCQKEGPPSCLSLFSRCFTKQFPIQNPIWCLIQKLQQNHCPFVLHKQLTRHDHMLLCQRSRLGRTFCPLSEQKMYVGFEFYHWLSLCTHQVHLDKIYMAAPSTSSPNKRFVTWGSLNVR